MKLENLTLLNFKNIASADLHLAPGINCLVGVNGAGKTNVLDALHYLSLGKGAAGLSDLQNVRHGGDFFMVDGRYSSDKGNGEQIVCSFSREAGKVLKRSGKQYERLSDHIGLVPLVVVLPSDVFLVSDAAEERRRYLNSLISQLDSAYLDAVIRYNAVLSQRNRMLRESDGMCLEDMLSIFDVQLCEYGMRIHVRRAEITGKLAPLAARYYAALSGDREQIELSYRSELTGGDFAGQLAASRERDRANRFTTCGAHRDDLVMKIGGYPLKKYGSQGQQKSFLVALKLAQYAVVARELGEKPILLLDDLFDKLDADRVTRLLELVSADEFGQIFITDCNEQRLTEILNGRGCHYALFEIEDGVIIEKQAQ